jgi:hypothetical protein
MAERKKSSFMFILAVLVGLAFFFVGFGVFYESTLVGLAEYEPAVADSPNLSAKLFKLKGDGYLLVLSEIAGRRTEGYYINVPAKRLGYARFSIGTYTPITESLAMVNRAVYDGFRIVEELDADFQTLPDGVAVTLKGPSELALALDPNVEQLYQRRLICQKTILLEH